MRDILEKLAEPIPDELISWKIQAVSRDGKRGLVVPYIDARVVIDRLNSVAGDDWSDEYEIYEGKIRGTNGAIDGYYAVCTLMVGGVSRRDVGEGEYPKDAISDALKRAALKFGIGRNLYSGNKFWADVENGRIVTPREQLFKLWRGEVEQTAQPQQSAESKQQERSSDDKFDCEKLAGRPASDAQKRLVFVMLTKNRKLDKQAANDFISWLEIDNLDGAEVCKLIDDIKNEEAWAALWEAYQAERGVTELPF